jgi:hypothetical protein
MTESPPWAEYLVATSELAHAGRQWVEAEQRADADLQSRIAACDRDAARRTAETVARQRDFRQLLEQGHAHLRRVGLEELLPKRIPTQIATTTSAPAEPGSLLERISVLSSSLGEQRRTAEQRRLDSEEAERRRQAEAEASAAQQRALRTTLLKVSAGAVVALVAIASVRACTGL